jgi:hypothetical protein
MQPIALKSERPYLKQATYTKGKNNMNIPPLAPITDLRSDLAHKFHSMRAHAQRELILGKLSGKETALQTFPSGIKSRNPNRKLLPMQDISLDHIVGTFNRSDDFDYKFRPLKKTSSDRWVNTYLTLEEEGWQPIVVHKIGDEYFVEDGHHRLSVAHELGMKFIQAKVWEYSVVEVVKVHACRSANCAETNATKLYIPG